MLKQSQVNHVVVAITTISAFFVIAAHAQSQPAKPLTIKVVEPPLGDIAGSSLLAIVGEGLGSNPTVTVGGRVCTVVCATPISVTCTLPAAQAAGVTQVMVSVAGQSSTPLNFSYVAYAPVMTSVSPKELPTSGGVALEITGRGFSKQVSDVKISVGGNACPVVSTAPDKVRCTAPAGQGTRVELALSVGDKQANVVRATDANKCGCSSWCT